MQVNSFPFIASALDPRHVASRFFCQHKSPSYSSVGESGKRGGCCENNEWNCFNSTSASSGAEATAARCEDDDDGVSGGDGPPSLDTNENTNSCATAMRVLSWT